MTIIFGAKILPIRADLDADARPINRILCTLPFFVVALARVHSRFHDFVDLERPRPNKSKFSLCAK